MPPPATHKRTGVVSGALTKIRKLRAGVSTALDEYEVKDENEDIYEIISEEEYQKRNINHSLGDFIDGEVFIDDEDYFEDEIDYNNIKNIEESDSVEPRRDIKTIKQHFVEIAQRDSANFKPPKPANTDREMLERLSKFEEDLENENFGLSRTTSQLFTQQNVATFPGPIAPRLMHAPHISTFATQFESTQQFDTQVVRTREGGLGRSQDFPTQTLQAREPLLDESMIETFGEVYGEDCAALEDGEQGQEATEGLEVEVLRGATQGSQVGVADATSDGTGDKVEMVDEKEERTTEDGVLIIYLLDVAEAQDGILHLFGRIKVGKGKTASCMVTITNMMRCLFFKANMGLSFDPSGKVIAGNTHDSSDVITSKDATYQRHLLRTFHGEVESLRHEYGIKKIKFKMVERKLLRFGPPKQEKYIKVCYPFANAAISKHHFVGTSFTEVYNATASATELLLLKRKIKGPCWLKIHGAQRVKESASFCQVEVAIESHKNVSLYSNPNGATEPPPPLCIAAISVKTVFVSPTAQEVLQVAMVFDRSCPVDDAQGLTPTLQNQYIGVRKLAAFNWPPELKSFLEKRPYFRIFEQERGLLANFNKYLEQLDPDVIVGHDIHQNALEVLLKRCNATNIPLRISFSRLKPTKRFSVPYFAGRLVCDSRQLTKELHPSRANYDLASCVADFLSATTNSLTTQAKESLYYLKSAFALSEVEPCFGEGTSALKNLLSLVHANTKVAADSVNLLMKIQALPLTRELTSIAGNLWARSIQCARSERNDFMLMHEFHSAKFVLDHNFESRHHSKATGGASTIVEDDGNDVGGAADASGGVGGGKRKKKGYEGGLVFEPDAGLYETFVLLLDFNSLYPSIIQEFNVCFTTATILENAEAAASLGEVVEEVEIDSEVPGMLPQILKRLVQLRASVKVALNNERNQTRQAQLGVRQLALKLAANSLYGCLGSVYSRFYAKHLAAYITKQGRMVLQATRDRVCTTYCLKVIYGDTDSLMIDTNIRDDGNVASFESAKNIATTIQTTINKSHSKLEMGIDAIFNRLLLLKKKKYAALKVVDYANKQFVREIKGLDFIRRDWSVLTKQVGNAILGIILGTESMANGVEGAVEQIHDVLREVNSKIAKNELPPKVWEITRQLARNPTEYSDVNNLPHVAVALRLNKAGAATYSAGHEVAFVICSKESIEKGNAAAGKESEGSGEEANAEEKKPSGGGASSKNLSARAFSLAEMLDNGYEPDVKYYKTQQLLPPIMRLCSVIRGTDAQKLARCLEVDEHVNSVILTSDFGNVDQEEQESRALALIKRTLYRYRDVELNTGVNCQFCNGFVVAGHLLKYFTCNHCNAWVPLHLIRNWVDRTLYEIALQGCFCVRICNICNTTTLAITPGVPDVCPQPTCASQDAMQELLPASKVHLYYDYLTFLLEGPLQDANTNETIEPMVNVQIDGLGKVVIIQKNNLGGADGFQSSQNGNELKNGITSARSNLNSARSMASAKATATYDELLDSIARGTLVKASSGFKACGQHILTLLEALPFLQVYTLDYSKEREILCSRVEAFQRQNTFSSVDLCKVFSAFRATQTIGTVD